MVNVWGLTQAGRWGEVTNYRYSDRDRDRDRDCGLIPKLLIY
jgi:hypothetical protein